MVYTQISLYLRYSVGAIARLVLVLEEDLVDEEGGSEQTRLGGGVGVGGELQLKVVRVRGDFLLHARPDLRDRAQLLSLLFSARRVDVERNTATTAAFGTQIHTHTAAAGGLVNVVLYLQVLLHHLKSWNTHPTCFLNSS